MITHNPPGNHHAHGHTAPHRPSGGARPRMSVVGRVRGSVVGGIPGVHHGILGHIPAGIDEGDEKKEGDVETAINAVNERRTEAPTISLPPYTQDVWTDDAEIVELRHLVSDSFRVLWDKGIDFYVKGDWQKARDIFHETMSMSNGKDGPSKFLMDVIDTSGGTAPHDWPGYRTEGGGH